MLILGVWVGELVPSGFVGVAVCRLFGFVWLLF